MDTQIVSQFRTGKSPNHNPQLGAPADPRSGNPIPVFFVLRTIFIGISDYGGNGSVSCYQWSGASLLLGYSLSLTERGVLRHFLRLRSWGFEFALFLTWFEVILEGVCEKSLSVGRK